MAEPSTDLEWTLHSINIHGVFFERWCDHIARSSPRWRVAGTQVPVEYPPPSGPIRGREGALDLWLKWDNGDASFSLLIECKKNNPDFVDWVFFEKAVVEKPARFLVPRLMTTKRAEPGKGFELESAIRALATTSKVADEARETRGNYQDFKDQRTKTKTANNFISDAAHQVALATQAIVSEQGRFMVALGNAASPQDPPWRLHHFFPVIVTTANLHTCSFDAAHVDPATGEIPLDKATVTPVDEVVYEYTMPRHLQSAPLDLAKTVAEGAWDHFWRLHMIVVRSTYFAQFLGAFINDGGNWGA